LDEHDLHANSAADHQLMPEDRQHVLQSILVRSQPGHTKN
jgi:hypothetical protein